MRLTSVFTMAILLGASCARPPAEDPTSPEGVYRAFMLANLAGKKEEIQPLILEHPQSALLWGGRRAYPPKVGELLSRQYREMKIVRTVDADDHVVLKSTAAPVPMDLRKIDGLWRLDVSPIIKFRLAGRPPEPSN